MEASDLKQAASGAARQSRSYISGQLGERSTQIGTTISSTANDLRRIADELRAGETVSGSADLATRGADAIDRFGSYLRDADGDQLIADMETFARERPWAVAAAALVAGFAASRVLKASSARRYRSAYDRTGYDGSGYNDPGYNGSGYNGAGYAS